MNSEGGKVMVKIFAAVVVAVVVMVVVFQFIDPNIETAGGNSPTQLVSSDSEDSMKVTISGQVTRPGTYVMELNSTLGDLVNVAKGPTANADELAYDTSYLLENGMSLYIAPKYDNNDVCSMEPILKVNINGDDEEGLQRVTGIGQTIAKAIVSYRTANGNFGCIEDLKKVTGIGNATFEKIKDNVRLRS